MELTFFEQKVGRRSRKAMVDFLVGHFRYSTMNSWNGMTSYGNCVKANRIGLTGEQYNRAFDVLETDYWPEIRWPIDEFTSDMRSEWTIGSNGRSGGYLVLYRSSLQETGHKSFCPTCGQRNFQAVSDANPNCGVCRSLRVDYQHQPKTLSVSMAGVDQGEDFADWSMAALRDRVDLVCRFDRACDEVRAAFINLCDHAQVVEQTVMVPRTSKVLVLTD